MSLPPSYDNVNDSHVDAANAATVSDQVAMVEGRHVPEARRCGTTCALIASVARREGSSLIRFTVQVELDFPRSQSEVFAFLEDPQSMVEAGDAVQATGTIGHGGAGTLTTVGPKGEQALSSFRVIEYDPPTRTVTDQTLSAPWLRRYSWRGVVKAREENLYRPTMSGCRVTRTATYSFAQLFPRRGATAALRKAHTDGTLASLQHLREALLRRPAPTMPDQPPEPSKDLPARNLM
jgi:hypothetical protein